MRRKPFLDWFWYEAGPLVIGLGITSAVLALVGVLALLIIMTDGWGLFGILPASAGIVAWRYLNSGEQ